MNTYREKEVQRRNQGHLQFRSGLDLAMGVLYVIIPAYAMALPYLVEEYGKTVVYTICSLFAVYGLMRIGRGWMAMRKLMQRRKQGS